MDLMALVARLTLDKSNYDQGLTDAQNSASSFGAKLKSGLGTAAKVGTAALAAVGTAATAMTKAVVAGAGEVAAFGDNIDKASQKLGISAEAYQEWDAVLQHSGTSIDSMGLGMKTLANAAVGGSEAFTKLGMSQEKVAGMSREELFSETITALQNVTDENERARLAQELFGRSAMELGALLNTSAEETQAMKDRVHELGGVMSNEAVKAAAKYQDSLQDMQTAFAGLKRGMMAEFLPAMTTVMDGLAELFSGGDGVEKIADGMGQFVDKLTETVPRVLDVGSGIVVKLADSIIKNLPKLISAATKTVITLADGIIKELPALIKTGLQVIVELARGIAEALPALTPTIVGVVLEIVDIMTQPDTLASLMDAAIAIMIALAEGLIKAIPQVIAAVPTIIGNIVGSLIEGAPQLLDAGVQLIGKLIEGLLEPLDEVAAAIDKIIGVIEKKFADAVDRAAAWGRRLIRSYASGLYGYDLPPEGSEYEQFLLSHPEITRQYLLGHNDFQGNIGIAANTIHEPAIPTTGQEIVVPRDSGATGSMQRQTPVMMVDRTVFARLIYTLYNEEAARVGVKLAEVK